MNCPQIQNELKKGMSIKEVCVKQNITFKELVELLQRGSKRPQKTREKALTRNEHYIFVRKDRYAIRKSINGKTKMFGTYNTMEDAVLMREALKKDGWHQTHVDDLCLELGIERRKGQINETVKYS